MRGLSESVISGMRQMKKCSMVEVKETVNMPVLQSELSNLVQQYPTIQPSVYVWDYDTGNYIDINASKYMQQQVL